MMKKLFLLLLITAVCLNPVYAQKRKTTKKEACSCYSRENSRRETIRGTIAINGKGYVHR